MRDTSLPLLALLTLSGCSTAPTPTTPPATCDSGTTATPESWATWQISATITPDDPRSPAAVPTVHTTPSGPSPIHPGDDPTAPRVWRCDGYTMLALQLSEADQPPATSISVELPRTRCTGDRVTSNSGNGTLRLVERTSWCSEDLGGGSEAGFDGWWIDVTDADTGTYTWARDITWTREPSEASDPITTSPTPIEGSGHISVTAVLSP